MHPIIIMTVCLIYASETNPRIRKFYANLVGMGLEEVALEAVGIVSFTPQASSAAN